MLFWRNGVKLLDRNMTSQTFHSVNLSKIPFVGDLELSSKVAWGNDAKEFFRGNIIAKVIEVNGQLLNAVNIYGPAWIVPASVAVHKTAMPATGSGVSAPGSGA